MHRRFASAPLIGLCLLLISTGRATAAAPSGDDRQLVAIVASRIFAAADPASGWAWPPMVAISDNGGANAFATICRIRPGDHPAIPEAGRLTWIALPGAGATGADAAESPVRTDERRNDGTIFQPVIVICQGYLDRIVRGAPDRLAAALGHETAHILLRHVENVPPGAVLTAPSIGRRQEAEADVLGMKLALTADFAYKGLVAGILAMRNEEGDNSLEGRNETHPAWSDRVALIDERQSELWHSAGALDSGAFFLMTEQYLLAERCFDQVVKDFPRCYAAWANLGYARLMRYCDALEPEDLRQFDVGLLVVGGFYRRPDSLGVRGIDERLWFDAVGALRQALILKPELVLPKANLAVAYLVHPQGKDVGRAAELFDQVAVALREGDVEEGVDPIVRASLLVNAGVAEAAHGDAASASAMFQQAREALAEARAPAGRRAVLEAIRYNRGRMLAASSQSEERAAALQEFELYLAGGSPAAAWWTLAYEQYEKLCATLEVGAKPRAELLRMADERHRLATGVTLPGGETITLSDPLATLGQSLGEGRRQVVVRQSNVHRRHYGQLGLELLCTDRVVAIRLRGAAAPVVPIGGAGAGGPTHELRTGMTVAELDALLGADANQWDQRYGASAEIAYRFYARLGFGVRLDGDRISEIVVAQIPIESLPQ